MAVYAIGDLQGCYHSLQSLLQKISFNPKNDQLWFTGDLINRGPDSLSCLRFVHSLGSAAKTVLGNHDLHFLAVATGQTKAKRKDTFDEILSVPDKNTLIEWLLQLPLLHHDASQGYTMVHAGIPPQWSIQQAQTLASEVHKALQTDARTAFFAQMYGNEPALFHEGLEGPDRLRVITNYFTRMRIINDQGALNLSYKQGLNTIPEGWQPWFKPTLLSVQNNHLIFGHWAALMGQTHRDDVHALDTGCVWGNQLTAMRLGDNQRISVNCCEQL